MINPTDLSKLSNVVKNGVVKKTVYDKLVAKVNAIDTSDFVSKTKYDTDKSELENKTLDTSGLVKNTDYNTEITKIESKIPDVSNLALTTVENKIPNVSRLATKAELYAYESKILDISKFATKPVLTNLSNTVPDISTLIKKSDYDTEIAKNENKYVSNTRFDSKLAQANVIIKINFDVKIIELENNIKNYKHLIRAILEVKVILKKMVYKII